MFRWCQLPQCHLLHRHSGPQRLCNLPADLLAFRSSQKLITAGVNMLCMTLLYISSSIIVRVARTAISGHLPIHASIPKHVKRNVLAQQKEGVTAAHATLSTEIWQHRH